MIGSKDPHVSIRSDEIAFNSKFVKIAAKTIVKKCYYKGCLGLDRKIKLAKECCSSYIGWRQSKTVLN